MGKHKLELVLKTQIIPKIYFLVFQTENSILFKEGQFFSFKIKDKEYRSYSIVSCQKSVPKFAIPKIKTLSKKDYGNYVTFIINTKPAGLASKIIEETKLKTTFEAVGPSGNFNLINLNKTANFVATGTGIAPFIGMIKKILKNNALSKIRVFFGCLNLDSDFSLIFFKMFLDKKKYPNFELYVVYEYIDTQVKITKKNFFKGRVTDIIPNIIKDYKNEDFYLCGHPLMVEDTEKLLQNMGAKENIYKEKFGK